MNLKGDAVLDPNFSTLKIANCFEKQKDRFAGGFKYDIYFDTPRHDIN